MAVLFVATAWLAQRSHGSCLCLCVCVYGHNLVSVMTNLATLQRQPLRYVMPGCTSMGQGTALICHCP